MTRRKTRSRRPDPLLRMPAQSLTDLINQLINDKLLDYLFFPVIAVLWAMHEWIRHWLAFAPQHLAATGIAVLAMAISAVGIIRLGRRLSTEKGGAEGEPSVGHCLEQFRTQGYQIFHDVPGALVRGRYVNIDHVLIGPGGVFTIEIKNESRPASGHCIVESDKQNVLINGVLSRHDPIRQALAQRHYLRNLLIESTGQAYPVRPVIVYPGWYVQNKSPGSTVQVLNQSMIHQALNSSVTTLADDQIHMASYHLSRHIMTLSKAAA